MTEPSTPPLHTPDRTISPAPADGHAATVLSPWPLRLLAWLVLLAVALASVWLVDRRAMQRQHQLIHQTIHASFAHP